jgi:hypothetical protein
MDGKKAADAPATAAITPLENSGVWTADNALVEAVRTVDEFKQDKESVLKRKKRPHVRSNPKTKLKRDKMDPLINQSRKLLLHFAGGWGPVAQQSQAKRKADNRSQSLPCAVS